MTISRIHMLPVVAEEESEKNVLDVVVQEIKKIVTEHGRTLLMIQLVIVLPISAMMMLSDVMFEKLAHSLLPVPAPRRIFSDGSSVATFPRFFPAAQMFRHIHVSFQSSQVPLTLIAAMGVGWFNLFISVHYIAANVFAVIYFHAGKSPTLMDVLQMASMLRKRLMVTGYWGYLFTFAASLPRLMYVRLDSLEDPLWIFMLIVFFESSISFVVSFYVSPIYQVANCIGCCEENTGLAGFMKSVNLFDRKLLLKASFPVEASLRLWGMTAHTVSLLRLLYKGPSFYVFSVVAEMLVNSLITQLAIVCWTLVYIWLKEYHGESVEIAYPTNGSGVHMSNIFEDLGPNSFTNSDVGSLFAIISARVSK